MGKRTKHAALACLIVTGGAKNYINRILKFSFISLFFRPVGLGQVVHRGV